MTLISEIARCPIAKAILENPSSNNDCSEIVLSQDIQAAGGFQAPEPWSGHISTARLLFLSSNPSYSAEEAYPVWPCSDETLVDFFEHRFGGGQREWVRDGKKGLRKDNGYSDSVPFWASVRQRAKELYGKEVNPGVDYALSEVVHCKSKNEVGVRRAMAQCSLRYLNKVLALSNARVIVVLGDIAGAAVASIYQIGRDKKHVLIPSKSGKEERHIVFLPHPNARAKRTFRTALPARTLSLLQKALSE